MSYNASNAVNYTEVMNLLESIGDFKYVNFDGRPHRGHAHSDDKRNTKAWYQGSIGITSSGATYINGAAGVWQGSDNNKIAFPKGEGVVLSQEDKAMFRKQQNEMKRRAEMEVKAKQNKASLEASRRFRAYHAEGDSGYLSRKQVGAFGVRFTREGAIAVPVQDTHGKIYGIQFIFDKQNDEHRQQIKRLDGGDKRFWPAGLKVSGNFHVMGVPSNSDVIIVVEGYATGATLHEATDRCVVVAYNANNIKPVVEALRKQYKRAPILIAADDDYLCRCQACRKQTVVEAEGKLAPCSHCGEAHGKVNTGVKVAINTCNSVHNTAWALPQFAARDARKVTDFNDLQVDEGMAVVRAQLEAAIKDKFPKAGSAVVAAKQDVAGADGSGGAGRKLSPLITVEQACARFSIIYGLKDVCFDHLEHEVVPKSSVLEIIPDHGYREWKLMPERKVVRVREIGFDPTGEDKEISCNLFKGWPTVPSNKGSCEKLLGLLEYLCSENGRDVYEWVLKWLAYPIQNPGAKMKTSLAIHGEEGTGKNLFFDAIKAIYKNYGFIIGQDALEDNFTDWMSAKLFLVANEVVARQELFHTKNKIKSFITDDEIRIRTPYVKSMWEKNHANFVFLSNELQPLVLAGCDRRFLVIWTPKLRDKAYYSAIGEELRNGGVAALHHYLLHLDLGDFMPNTAVIDTKAKQDLIALSKEGHERFMDEWEAGETQWEYQMCRTTDLYRCYRQWSNEQGERFVLTQNRFILHVSKREGVSAGRFNIMDDMGHRKTVRVIELANEEMPEGTSLIAWRTRMLQKFQHKMSDQGEF